MRIAVIGASGWLGGSVAREAAARGHRVTAIARNRERLAELEGMSLVAADVTDHSGIAAAISHHDVVVLSIADRSTPDRSIIPTAVAAVLAALPRAGVPRMAMVGGGGSLLDEHGTRFVDRPDFREQYKPEALAQSEALALLRHAPASVDWTYISPPPANLTRAEKRGGYSVRADDRPVTDETGSFTITSGDLASALLDEIEQPQFSRLRFTVGYASAPT